MHNNGDITGEMHLCNVAGKRKTVRLVGWPPARMDIAGITLRPRPELKTECCDTEKIRLAHNAGYTLLFV